MHRNNDLNRIGQLATLADRNEIINGFNWMLNLIISTHDASPEKKSVGK